jgi:hypothetical protein
MQRMVAIESIFYWLERKHYMRRSILAVAVAATCAGLSLNAQAEGTTKVGGKAYVDFTSIQQENTSGAKVDPSGIGADVKRFYLGIDHTFDDMWSANLTTDFNYVAADSETQLYVKKAYVQAKFDPALVLRAGVSDLPWIPYAEELYGYRYVENVLIDRLKFGTSADWGLHASGKFGGGMVNYALSGVNGAGYKNPSRSKTLDFEGRIGLTPIAGLNLAAGFYSGKLGKDTYANVTPLNTASRFNLMAAYLQPSYRLGAEYFQAKNWAVTTADKATGYSLWGSVDVAEKVALFARYDKADPKKTTAPTLRDTYYNLGAQYQVNKDINLALVYKADKTDNGVVSTSNGTINGKYQEIGVWSQIKF